MLEVRKLVKVYRPKKGSDVVALNGVSLKFPEKGMVFILGKSGSGKSTLLNVLGGLDCYDEGEIIIKGKSSRNFKQSEFDSYRNTYVGFIFQEYNILAEFTVGANIALALELQGKRGTSTRVNEILKEVDLEGYGGRKVTELSGGQKQRVAIARALVKNPDIIMADEPTGALDSTTGLQVFDTLKKLATDKLVIVITHDRDFAELYGDRVIELKDGRILSDIEKHLSNAQEFSEGVKIVDEKIIQLKKGYTLTPKDTRLINEYLTHSDAILSVDEKANGDLRRFARIGEGGTKESFSDTDESKIPVNKDGGFKLIRSRLPFKNAFKIGASSLKNKPFRLAITILLSMIAFTLFGLIDTIQAYNSSASTYQTLMKNDQAGLAIKKTNPKYKSFGSDENYRISEKQQLSLNEKYGTTFYPTIQKSNDFSSFFIQQLNNRDNQSYFQSSMQLIVALDEEAVAPDNRITVHGRLPRNNTEVAIPLYIFRHFVDFGYRYQWTELPTTPGELPEPKKIEFPVGTATINKFLESEPFLRYDNDTVKVCGIVDTRFNENRYAPLKTTINSSIGFYQLHTQMMEDINYGLHGAMFVHSTVMDESVEKYTNKHEDIMDLDYEWSLYKQIKDGRSDMVFHGINSITGFTQSKSSFPNRYFFDNTKTTLSDNEVMLDVNALILLLDYSRSWDYALNTILHSLLNQSYLKSTVAEEDAFIKQNMTKWMNANIYPMNHTLDALLAMTETKLIEAYRSEIAFHDTIPKIQFQSYKLSQYLQSIIIPYFQANTMELFSELSLMGFEEKFSIVGLFVPEKNLKMYNSSADYKMLMLSDRHFNETKNLYDGVYFTLITTTADKNIIKNIVYGDAKDENYNLKGGTFAIVGFIQQMLEPFSSVFLYAGLVIALFSALMLANFIATSIAYKKREIGILRAVGARSLDVYSIFCYESIIISCINSFLACLAALGTTFLLNDNMQKNFFLDIRILRFGIRQIALIIAISLVVSLIASFLPSYKISKKRPVDAIRG